MITTHVKSVRRILALVCIVAVVVAGLTLSASELAAIVLAPIVPLFAVVVIVPVACADAVPLTPAPVLDVRGPRAPPLA